MQIAFIINPFFFLCYMGKQSNVPVHICIRVNNVFHQKSAKITEQHKQTFNDRSSSPFSCLLSRIVWVYLTVGVWVYPLLGHFSAAGLLGFFLFNMTVVTLLYLLGDRLNSHVWSERRWVLFAL